MYINIDEHNVTWLHGKIPLVLSKWTNLRRVRPLSNGSNVFGQKFPKNKTKYTRCTLPSSDIYILLTPHAFLKVSTNNNEREEDLHAYQGIESYKESR